jgi:hypothetical protein
MPEHLTSSIKDYENDLPDLRSPSRIMTVSRKYYILSG